MSYFSLIHIITIIIGILFLINLHNNKSEVFLKNARKIKIKVQERKFSVEFFHFELQYGSHLQQHPRR